MLKKFYFLFCLIVLNMLAQTAYARQERLFESGMCLQVKFNQGQPLQDLSMVKALGVKWVRESIAWAKLEKTKGVYEPFPEDFKKRLHFYKENDVGVVFVLAYDNYAAYPNTPQDLAASVNPMAFAKYAEYIARELKKYGVRYVIELWNEPHGKGHKLRDKFGGNWNGKPPSPWLDHYVLMVNEAVKRIKAYDSSVKVISDDDMWVLHYHFLEKGLHKELDGFAIHPYNGGKPPEMTAAKYNSDWTRPYQVVDMDQSFESAVRRLKEQGLKKMGKTPTIWSTEWGWRVGESSSTGPMTEATIAAYLPRAYILAESAEVESTCWFSSQDRADGAFGLKTNDGRYRPAYDAYLKLSQTLAKTSFKCELKSPDGSTTKRAFAFQKSTDNPSNATGWVIASWDTAGQTVSDETVVYTEKNGAEFTPECK